LLATASGVGSSGRGYILDIIFKGVGSSGRGYILDIRQ